jgi:tetrapyrrole (corrin/porphyrin) methylase-like protein
LPAPGATTDDANPRHRGNRRRDRAARPLDREGMFSVNQSQQQPRLYVLGAGVSFPEHLTLQTLDILDTCTRICSNLPQSDLDLLPENLRSKCISLWPIYQENRERADNYKDVAQAVIDAANANPPVAWLTPGHPLIFDSVSQALLTFGQTQGWNVHVAPAISCIDTILAEVGYDPANGLLVYEAYSLVMRQLPLITSFATLLLQPSAFGSDLTHYTSQWSPDLSPLRDHLLQYFDPAHQCAFIRSQSRQGTPLQISWRQLGDMTSVSPDDIAGSTLFVPPVEQN